jgi:hypothetical protein
MRPVALETGKLTVLPVDPGLTPAAYVADATSLITTMRARILAFALDDVITTL